MSGKAGLDPTSAEGSVDYDIITGKKKYVGTSENVDSLGNTMLGNEVKERFGSTRAAFLKMDANRDGRITVGEVRQLCRQWNIPQAEADRVLQAADLDANGTMDYLEFAKRFDPDYYRPRDGEPVDMASSTAIGAVYDNRPIASSGWANFSDAEYSDAQAQSATKIQAAARGKQARTRSGRLAKERSGQVSGGPAPRGFGGTGNLRDMEDSRGSPTGEMSTPAGSGSRAARSIKTEALEQENAELKARVAELEEENAMLKKALAASQAREAELAERSQSGGRPSPQSPSMERTRAAPSPDGVGRGGGGASPAPGKGASVRFEEEEEEEPLKDVVVYGQQDDKKTQAVMIELKKNGVNFDAFDFNSTKDYMKALKASGFPDNGKVVPPIVVVFGKHAFWDEPGAAIAVHFPTMLINELRKLGKVAAVADVQVAPRNVTMDVEIQERFHNMQDAFLKLDDNRDGRITRDELRQMCKRWNIPQSEAERVVREADFDSNGTLDFREFCRRFGR